MPGIKGDGMRGLAVFISDIRNCKSKEAECKRINKELANIRSKFKGETVLDGYSKKKYICKLLFIFLLGHEVEFGYMEAVNLLTSNKYSEKQIGYLFVSIMLPRNSDLYKLIIHNIRADLTSQNPIFENLALQCIANICNSEVAEEFAEPVGKLLIAGITSDAIKQSAALALLTIFRTYPETVQRNPSFLSRIMQNMTNNHLGVVISITNLLEGLCKDSSSSPSNQLKPVVSLAINRLHRLLNANFNDFQDYLYYFIPAPWLCVALMKLLQNFPPAEDAADRARLNDCIECILFKNQEPPKSKKIQHTNARYAVFFEAVSLCIHLDNEQGLLVRCANQLGHFLEHRETNLRYLALESLCLLATSDYSREAVKTHRNIVVKSLQTEKDLTVRRKAVDVLYSICDKTNVKFVVGQLLDYLSSCDYQLKEEMALKISILTEKFAVDYSWYIDVMLKLIRIAGDFVADEVWHRVVQVVSAKEDVQSYAAKTCFEYIQMDSVHDAMVKLAGYILGEFGNYIANDPRSSPKVQLALLQSHFLNCSQSTRCLLLSSYIKFANLYPSLKPQIETIFRNDLNIRSADVECQQRAVEYLKMSQNCASETLATILDVIPAFELKLNGTAITPQQQQISAVKREEKLLLDDSLTSTDEDRKTITAFPSKPIGDANVPAARQTFTTPEKQTSIPGPHESPSTKAFERLINRNFGILHEDYQVQIGFRDEYKGPSGILFIYVGNKSKRRMEGVRISLWVGSTSLDVPDSDLGPISGISVHWLTSLPSVIDAGQQLMCSIGVDLISAFDSDLTAAIRFEWSSAAKKQTPIYDEAKFRLPVFLNKFCDSAAMNAEAFNARWNHLDQPGQQFETKLQQLVATADNDKLQKSLKSFGWSVMRSPTDAGSAESKDYSFYGAALITFKPGNKVGLLFRAEKEDSAVVLRIRCVKPEIGQIVSSLLFKSLNCSLKDANNT